jgi:hypothetical protein
LKEAKNAFNTMSWTSDLQHHIRCTNKKHSTSVDPDGVHEKRCMYPGEPFHEFWKREAA